MKVIRTAAAVTAMMALLVLVGGASAQTPSEGGYSTPGAQVERQLDRDRPIVDDGLPFSGFDVLLVLGVAGLLLAAGLTLRRLSGQHH